ncbi:MAG: hypothetical protein ACRD03_00170 [Acidimicrobiales bacterium]
MHDAVAGEAVYTTGCWYYRLARALLAASGAGSLSSRLEAVGPAARDDALESVRRLPDRIGLVSLRTSAPVMATLPVRRSLNMLNAEALAVALIVRGGLVVTVDSDLLRDGAADLGVGYQVLGDAP